jgi:branched-chain amino acid transport system substrate-binding protein
MTTTPKEGNMNKRQMILLAMALLALTVAADLEAKTYKIASSLAITGPTSDAGAPYAKGMEDYARFANDQKLLGDDQVEMIIRDDQYKTDVTKRNFEEFIGQGIVIYLNYSTGSTLGLKRDFDEEKMPTLPASFHRGNLDDSSYIFLPITSYSGQVIALAEYMVKNHKNGVPKAAMFIHPSAFGRAPVDDIKKAIGAGLKMEIVEVVEHGQDLDNTAMLQRLMSKGVQYVICQTVQSPVATLLNDAQRLGVIAKQFGEPGKLTFMGAHYTGGNDLIDLAGAAAEGFFWTTSYKLTSEHKDLAQQQTAIAKKYGRDDKTANSHNYTNGMMVTQVAIEAMRRLKAKNKEINKQNLYEELLAMNENAAYSPFTTVGPVTFSKTDKEGVDTLQLYVVKDGAFRSVGTPFMPETYKKLFTK